MNWNNQGGGPGVRNGPNPWGRDRKAADPDARPDLKI